MAINADTVRREERGVEDVLVAPVAFLTNSDQLHRGYVPEDEVRASADAWEGVSITLSHPRDAIGEPTSVADDDGTPVVGRLESVAWDDDEGVLRGDAVLFLSMLTDHREGIQAMNALDSGRSVGVSASYYGANLPTGHYDGERRERVKGDLRPDHVALLEDDTGRLGIRDGIGTGAVAANAEDTGPDSIATTVAAVEARQADDADERDRRERRSDRRGGIPTTVPAVERAAERGDRDPPTPETGVTPTVTGSEARQADDGGDESATTGIATSVTGAERRRRAESAGDDASEDGDEGAASFPSLTVNGRTGHRGDAERNGGETR